MTATEVKFILKMGRTAMLIMTYPFILIALFGVAFPNTDALTRQYPIVVYDQTGGKSSELISALENSSHIRAVYSTSQEDLIYQVSRGTASLGAIYSSDADGQTITFYIDQEKSWLANKIIFAAEEQIAVRKGALVKSSIKDISSGLNSTASEMENGTAYLDAANQSLEQMRSGVDANLAKAQQIADKSTGLKSGVASAKTSIDSMNSDVNSLASRESEIDDAVTRIENAKASLDQTSTDLENFDAKRSSYIAKIDSATNRLTQIDIELTSVQQQITSIRPYVTDPTALSYFNNISPQVSSTRGEITSSLSDLASARADLIAVDVPGYRLRITNTRADLVVMETKLQDTKQQLTTKRGQWLNQSAAMSSTLDDANSALADVDTFLQGFRADSQSAMDKIDNMSGSIAIAKDKVKSMSALLMSEANVNSDELQPIRISLMSVSPNSSMLATIFPILIALDMVLASTLLPMIAGVALKLQGMDFRIKQSRMGSFSFVMGRFLGNYLISLVQVLIVSGCAIVFFGVGDIKSWAAVGLVTLLVPAVFTSVGVLFSLFVDKESTAILITILLSITSIFFSGAVLPLEALPSPFDIIGQILPMTLVKNAISKSFIRGLDIGAILPEIFVLATFVGFCLFASVAYRAIEKDA